jgi:hypothetical protein
MAQAINSQEYSESIVPGSSVKVIPDSRDNPLSAYELKSRLNLCSFVSRFTALRRSGRQFVGLCPLHPETQPSFYIHAEKQVFYCFGCGAGGDVFEFVMRLEGCDFYRALRIVSESLGGVARANKPRSGLWFGESEGVKPLSPPKADASYSQFQQSARSQILEKLEATNRRLRLMDATNREASAALSTGCEPLRHARPFTCQEPDNFSHE